MKKKLVGLLLVLLLVIPLLVSCTSDIPGYGTVVDVDGDAVIIDEVSRAIVIISFTEHKLHEGEAFSYVDEVDLAINNVRDIQITTPNTTEWAHFTFHISTESETEWYLYENVTINVAGVGIVEQNANRNSGHAATTTLATIDNNNLANANADTAVAGAVEIYHGTSGAGKDAGEHDHEHELILAQNEDYTIRLVATVAGYVSYHIDWYEHTSLD